MYKYINNFHNKTIIKYFQVVHSSLDIYEDKMINQLNLNFDFSIDVN